MSDDASPFFIRPHRFDDPPTDDGAFPTLDGRQQIVLDAGEQILWRDRLSVAGYLLGPPAGVRELRWSLSRPADVIVTDRRLAYVCADWEMTSARPGVVPDIQSGARHRFRSQRSRTRHAVGQIRWQWPSRLQLLTGDPAAVDRARATAPRPTAASTANSRPVAAPRPHRPSAGITINGGPPPGLRPAAANGGPARGRRPAAWRGAQPAPDDQLLIVCDALRSTRQPALALAAASGQPARTALELAIAVRRAIARFRLANPDTVELAPIERDALRVRAGAASFADELTDPNRGVAMPGALVIEFLDPMDYYRWSPQRSADHRHGDGGRFASGRPGSAC